MEESIIQDLSIALEENPNVIRCRNYRDRKRNLMKDGEMELINLTRINNDLKGREFYLDTIIDSLQKYYIRMIKEKQYKCCEK